PLVVATHRAKYSEIPSTSLGALLKTPKKILPKVTHQQQASPLVRGQFHQSCSASWYERRTRIRLSFHKTLPLRQIPQGGWIEEMANHQWLVGKQSFPGRKSSE